METSSISNILNLHFNHAVGNHLSDKSDEYGFNEHQNELIKESKVLLVQIGKYEKLVYNYINKTIKRTTNGKNTYHNLFNKNIQSQLIKVMEMVFTSFKAIASDVDYNNFENDEDLRLEIYKLTTSPEFLDLITSMGINVSSARMSTIFTTFSEIDTLIHKFIEYKKTKRLSFWQDLKNKKKTFQDNLPKKGKFKLAAKLGMVGLGVGAAKGLSLFFKSPGLDKLKYPAEAWLAKIGYDVKKQHDARLHLKQQISRSRSDLAGQVAAGKITNALAGGGSFKAKRNAHVLIGDNPGGKEKYTIKRGSSLFGGKTSGPTLMNMKIGDRINATPLSGKGITKANPSDFSQFGAGTGQEEMPVGAANSVVHAINKNTSVLLQMWKSQENYYKDEEARKDDFANASKGIGKSTFGNTMGEKIGGLVDSKDKGSYIGGLIKDIIKDTIIGSSTAILVSGKAKEIASKVPMIGKYFKTGVTIPEGFNPEVLPQAATKGAGWLKTGGKFLGQLGFGINAGMEGKSAYSNFKKGNNLQGAYHGVNSAMSAMAMSSDPIVGGIGKTWTLATTVGDWLEKTFIKGKIGEGIYDFFHNDFWDNLSKSPFMTAIGDFGKATKDAVSKGWSATKEAVSNAWSAGKEAVGLGSRSVRNNNPGNIKVPAGGLDVARERYGDPNVSIDPNPASDGGSFLKFSTPEIGKAAIPKLLKTTSSNLTVDTALRNWSHQAYGDEIVPSLKGKTIGSLNDDEMGQLQNAIQSREGWKPAAVNRNASLPSQIDAAQQSSVGIPTATSPSSFKQSQAEIQMVDGYGRMKANEQEATQRAVNDSILGFGSNVSNTIINNVSNGGGNKSTPIITSGDNSLLSFYTSRLAGGF